MPEIQYTAKCALCCAGGCGHDNCGPSDAMSEGQSRGYPAVTTVAGTQVCGDCARVVLAMWEGYLPKPKASAIRTDPDDPQWCTATSWMYGKGRKRNRYGPGGWNRCILTVDSHADYAGAIVHKDGFGNRFVMEPHFEVLERKPSSGKRPVTDAELEHGVIGEDATEEEVDGFLSAVQEGRERDV